MAKGFLTGPQDRLRDQRFAVIPESHFDRKWFRFAIALMLAWSIIVSVLPASSRADRVAASAVAYAAAYRDRAALAGQHLASTEQANDLAPARLSDRRVGSSARANSSIEDGRARTATWLPFAARFGNANLPRKRHTTLLRRAAMDLRVRPNVGNVVPERTNALQAGATTEGRPPITSGAGLFGSTPKIFSTAPSPDLFTGTHSSGFRQSQGDGANRSVPLGRLFAMPGEASTISNSYPAITPPFRMTSNTAVTSEPTISEGGESKTDPGPHDRTSSVGAMGKPRAKTIKSQAKITINAEGRGSPHVNFQDGRELSVSAPENNGVGAHAANSAPPRAMASGDFDSDGVADLVTADSNGTLKLYRGNVDSIYPNSAQAKQRRADGTFVDSPFYPSENSFALGTPPDFLEVGDFNADGRKDVLALARGDNRLQLLWGDGRGNFSAPVTVLLSGNATALAVGEIGRRDGQTDVAIAILNKTGARLLVFEHPEGAFKHGPEVFVLLSAATDLSIGHLDKDSYGDVAIASGNSLTIVHGRGQAYPLDLKADLDIERPSAFVQTRQLAFDISALAIGRFTGSRADSLAVLATEGSVYTLEPQREASGSAVRKPTAEQLQKTKKLSFAPARAESGVRTLAALKGDSPRTEQEADQSGQLMVDTTALKADREKTIREKLDRLTADFIKLPKAEQDRITAEKTRKTQEDVRERKQEFERTLSSRPVLLAAFKVETLISDRQLANAPRSISARKLITARVSDSDRDDLVVVDSVGRQIQIVAQIKDKNQPTKTELISFDSEDAPLAVAPMRLNRDALNDLVVLRENSAIPSVLITAPANTFVVNTTADSSSGACDGSEPCALRRAMFLSNVLPGADLITFDIGGGGLQTINPLFELPQLTETVTIDGTTQPGFSGLPIIEIKGDNLVGPVDGVSVTSSNSVIRGLVVNEMPFSNNGDGSVTGGSGIVVHSTSGHPNVRNNIVEGNFLGTDPTGTLDKGNQATGLSIFDADVVLVLRNLMSGNGDLENTNIRGVGLAITGGNNNVIIRNSIGTDWSGTLKLGNDFGVLLTGIDNQFGTDLAGEGNLVSGNGTMINPNTGQCQGIGVGVDALFELDTGETATNNNTLKGNLIGTDWTGTAPLGNCETGIGSFANLNTFIGSITETGRNTISDNGYDAIRCVFNASFFFPLGGACTIVGNNVGTDITGSFPIPNDQRNGCSGICIVSDTVWVSPSSIDFVIVGSPGGTSPGGACTGFCNLVSGNLSPNLGGGGVHRTGFGNVFILNNYLGVNRAGTAALPNLTGFFGFHGSFALGAALNDGAGGFIDGGNVISGNDLGGLFALSIELGGTFEINGNLVGTSANGINGVPNGGGGNSSTGVSVQTSHGTQIRIGGTNPLQRNVIAATVSDGTSGGTRGDGIRLSSFGDAVVENNYIGLNKLGAPLGNTASGIVVNNGDGTARIGGTFPNQANLIKHNGAAGVFVYRFSSFFGGTALGRKTVIIGNSIADNGGLGIDLADFSSGVPAPDGVTPNDCFDDDEGGNNLQNFPVLLAPVFNANGTVTVTGTLRSTPARPFEIDFYSSAAADPSDYGEGETYLGSLQVLTDGNGFVSFTFDSAGMVASTQKITATATSEEVFFGNTSEFSCYAGQCTPTEPPCILPIVVNIESDEPDANTADGACDADPGTSGLQCSLRAAIQEANFRSTKDHINFDIPGAGVHKILVTSALPNITDRVVIDATTQPGYAGTPVVEVDGSLTPNLTNGLVLTLGGSTIRGLAINRFNAGDGIVVNNADNSVEACHIGVDPDGVSADASRPLKNGVSLVNGSTNLIGRANVIGNFTDAGVVISGGQGNKVFANRIGIRMVGSQPLGTGSYGVLMTSSATANTVGGDIIIGNLISGSLLVGIGLDGGANGNTIQGNLIGTGEDGNLSPFTHGETGILIKGGAGNNTIGGGVDQRNVIAGNDRSATSSGIHIEASAAATNKIFGNYIGTNIDGNARAGNSIGVLVDSGGVTIGGEGSKQNVISGNINQGILVQGETSLLSGVTISNNYIGTDPSGLNDFFLGNTVGVVIAKQVDDATIKNNTISGNLTGVDISLGAKATVSQNFIGTGASGETAIPNVIGIAVVQTTDCTIKNNIISGNRIGILLGDGIGPEPDPMSPQSEKLKKFYARHPRPNGATVFTEFITIQHNNIGTNLSGGSAVGNSFAGIAIGENARNNKIGGSISGTKGNVISGQFGEGVTGGYGIFIGTRTEVPVAEALPSDNLVQGNRIGLNATLNGVMPNKVGIYLSKAVGNFIGGGMADSTDTPNVANIIGGNLEDGVRVFGPLTQNNVIVNNFIGVTPAGTDVGNEGNGVAILDAPSNRVGVILNDNNEAGSSNVIVANHLNGILIEGSGAAFNNVFGNTIGIFRTPTQNFAMGNRKNGIKLLNVNDIAIGGTNAERRNFIGGNLEAGILISGIGSFLNRVKNNVIGTDEINTPDLGNVGDGVLINNQARVNFIGGQEPDSGNIITGNGGSAVRIDDTALCCNLVDPNSIYGNAVGGIDLGPPGHTPNDPGDADVGPNNLQNYPEFTSAVIATGGNLLLQYKVDSDPANSNYGANGLYIEFFKADASLQGKTFVGSTHYAVADYNNGTPGIAAYDAGSAASLGVVVGDKIVATASDADGNTSEFTDVNVGVVTSQPTAVKLASFTATAHDSSVLLKWQTGFEVDNLGFNVYREVDGTRTRITPQIVAGSALSGGPGTSLLSGYNYYWADTPPAGKMVRYFLEDIDLNGKSTFNGPYAITSSTPRNAEEAQRRSELISQIGMRQGLLENGLGSTPQARAATLATPTGAATQAQSGLASQPAVKIGVKQEGYYRVNQAEVVRAGLDPGVDPRLLQLFVDGIEQPIKVTGEQDGRFDASDTLEFYGVGLDSASADTRVYWLVQGKNPGKRIPIIQGKGDAIEPGGFPFTVERKDRTIYFSALRNGDVENFFGAVVASQPVDQSLWIHHLDQTAQAGASLEVSLQGVTNLPHNVRVQLNGTDVTRLAFAGQSQGRKLVSISQSLLREGENTVRLIAEGGASDVSLVDVIRISYSRSYVADSDGLRLTAQAGKQVTVVGFTTKDVRLMDVTDPGATQEIGATVTGDKTGYTVSGAVAGSGIRTLVAFADSQVKHPWSVTANQPSSWRQPANGADLLIITPRDFFSTVAALKSLRESQGLSVSVVDIEDVYDEFSFGNNTPQAVKDFAAYSATNWKKRPRFLLLAGDASYDPKNYLGLGGFDLVPTRLLDTAFMETASDDWFADFDNDGVPELAVGRLPFRNAGEASTMIAKLVGYDRSSPSEEVLLVADSNDGFDFEAASAQLIETIPASLRISRINRRTDTAAAKASLIEAVNRGQKLINYSGHGAVNQWRGNLLVNEDAAQMKNTEHLSVFVMMTCLNGYFDDPALDSLAESLLKAERGGAVAVWSSSGMTLPGDQARMNQRLYRELFSASGTALLGDAVRAAKVSIDDVDIRRTWILLGDPTMKLK